MSRIHAQSEDQCDLVIMVLSWITHAFLSLIIEESQHALTIEDENAILQRTGIIESSDLTSFCAGLVIIDKKNGTVALIHSITQEYEEIFFSEASFTVT